MAVVLQHREDYKFTYRDYLRMPDDGNRWEIIDGKLYMMAAPSFRHQEILGELFGNFYNFLKGKRCKVFMAPFDVRLPIYNERGEDVINVVQHDVMVYCDRKGVDEKGGKVAPEIAIEILSPSTSKMDKIAKYRLYEQAKVKEYWIVDGKSEFVEIHMLDGNKFSPPVHYCDDDMITTAILEGFELKASDIFPEPFFIEEE